MIDPAEHVAAVLVARGVPSTPDAIRAALRPPRAPDLERELARGYLAACAAWGKAPAFGAAGFEFEHEGATVRPGGGRT